MLRVDHAGEYGATRIYDGQLDVLGRGRAAGVIRQMAEAEKHHLARFETLVSTKARTADIAPPAVEYCRIRARRRDRAAGEQAAMACTVAVEEVIDEHYQDQPHTREDDRPFGMRSCRFATTRSHIATLRSRVGRGEPGL